MENMIFIEEGYDIQILEDVKELIIQIGVSDEFYEVTELSESENPRDAFTVRIKQSKQNNEYGVYLCNEGFLCEVQLSEEEEQQILQYVKEHNLHTKAGIDLP